MKKLTFSLLGILMCLPFLYSQSLNPKNKKDYTYYYMTNPVIENAHFKVTFEDVISRLAFCKLKIKITNKTADYLIFKGSEIIFKYPHGEFKPSEKDLIIKPFSSGFKVLNVQGNDKFQADTFTLVVNGFYTFPAKGVIQPAPDFLLPASSNTFTAGPFTCDMINLKKETEETGVKFKCTYSGKDVGIIDPDKGVVKIPAGQEYANGKLNAKPLILNPGEDDKFSLWFYVPGKVCDMQFANLTILWKDMFSESKISSIPGSSVQFYFDRGLTAGKNK